ncbi:glycosyltransferase family 2 protein [Atopococcus tabaci]|uniref:glycosyltransferase family 2 protein n=1 Tax=Atopococcus tabaci TaxID=269774 RepID=UPI0003FBA521|nr:glycosyltransferase family 2 protein [Atopococcus tabaci]
MYWKHPAVQAKPLNARARISVIIPARNEENNLPRLLESLENQTHQPFEVMVADDGSTDRTAETAERFGAKVVSVQKETGWRGKTAACFQGAQAASGEWLVFMDADTWLKDADALSKAASSFQYQGAKGLFSVQPYHEIQEDYENFSAVFNILTMAGMNVISAFNVEAAGAFGPFTMCAREEYFRVGGHEMAQHFLIEGFALAEAFQEDLLPVRLYSGKDMVHFRMYPEGLTQLKNGWIKHFASGSKGTYPSVMTAVVCWIAGGFLVPFFCILTLTTVNWAWILNGVLCYLLYAMQFYLFTCRTGSFSIQAALGYPALFGLFVMVFARSWLATNVLRTVQWKGQKIDL